MAGVPEKRKVHAAALGHARLDPLAVESHQDRVGVVLGLAEVDVEGFRFALAAIDADAGDVLLLDVLRLGVDQERLDVVLVQPGDAGAPHAQVRVHDRPDLLGHPAHRQHDVAREGAGDTVALVDGLLDEIRYQGDVHRHRGAVALHPAVGLDVFHVHLVAEVRRPDVLQHLLDRGPDVLGRRLGDLAYLARSGHLVCAAHGDLAVDRQRLAVHLAARFGVDDGQPHDVADRVRHRGDVFLEVLLVLADVPGEVAFQAEVLDQRLAHVAGLHPGRIFQDGLEFRGLDDAVDRSQDAAELAVRGTAAQLLDDLRHGAARELALLQPEVRRQALAEDVLAAAADTLVALPGDHLAPAALEVLTEVDDLLFDILGHVPDGFRRFGDRAFHVDDFAFVLDA